ncbi:MAG: 6-bladed beta-propeller [Tannerella sp.]|jgi:hypothetical protein|nr:6-bladed beta-propeller [Tannerella sp.]
MKISKLISGIILLAIITGCGGENKQSTDEIITVDVTANYPEKELILQDIMDVEYIPLETTDEFLTKGNVKAIGKDILLITNQSSDGDIFVFDRTGKGLRKINRFGQGGEEYSHASEIILDEDNNEMFVIDHPAEKILAYDLYGNFKRSFKFVETSRYSGIFNYDQDHLICYKGYTATMETEESCHLIISKQDGSITKEIKIPVNGFKSPVIMEEDLVVMPFFYQTAPYNDNWAITRTSSDTIYNYLPDGSINPFIVRTPSIQSMDPEVFLYPTVLTDRYYFMYVMKKELDYERMKFPGLIYLVYDKQENATFKYVIYNDDFSNKEQVYFWSAAVDKDIATWQKLEAYQLVESNEKGELKGKLKEIAAELNEESNPVIMLVKHKK